MKVKKMFIGLLMGLSILCLMTTMASAADYSIGGGIGIAPEYEGSDEYELVPLPAAKAQFSNGMYIELLGLNLRANLIPSNMWRLGPIYNYRSSRSDVDNSKVDDMKNVSDANEIGGFGGLEYKNWFVFLEVLADIGEAHDGLYATLKGGYNWVINDSWALSVSARSTYADDDYTQTYFGVTAEDADRSGLSPYKPDSGIKDVGLDLGVNWGFARNWDLRGLASVTRLVYDADDDSPVVDEGSEIQLFGGLMVLYNF